MGTEGHLEIIAVYELLTFIVLAASRQTAWQGDMILYVTGLKCAGMAAITSLQEPIRAGLTASSTENGG